MAKNQKSRTNEDVRRRRRTCKRLDPKEPQRRQPAGQTDLCLAQLEAVFESLEEGLVICDAAGDVLRMNRRALDIHEYASVGQAWRSLPEFADTFALYDPEGHPISPAEGPLSRAVRGETFRAWKVRIHNRRTGKEWSGGCSGTPVRDEQGHVVLTVLTLHERKEQAEKAAKERELAQLARIPQENPDPVFRVSAEHVLLYRNPAAEELCRSWGCRKGRKVPATVREIVSAALADGAVAQHEVALDSRTYWLTVAPSVADGCVNIYARDITDRKQAAEALREAEQRFRTVFDNTSDGIFLLELETSRFAMCNQSCLQMLGYTQEEFRKLGIQDLHPQEDLPFIYVQIEAFRKGGKGIRHDIRFRRKDGSTFFADLSPDFLLLDGRRYVLVALKDITERKQMEEELRRYSEHLEELVAARTGDLQESERRYRSLAENDPDIIQRFDRDLRHLYVNPAFARATGLSPEAVIGKTDRELGLPEELARLWEQAAHAVFQTGESQIIEFERPTPRGHRCYEAHLAPELARDGSPEHLLALTRDITERRQAEETLRASEALYRAVVADQTELICRYSPEGTLTFVNDAYCRYFGRQTKELVGTCFLPLVLEEDRAKVKEFVATLNPENPVRTLEERVVLPDGEIRWQQWTDRLMIDEQGREIGYQAVGRDITERKRAEEALRSLNERLELQVAQRTEDLRHTVGRLQQLTLEISQAEDRERRRIADLLHDDVQQTLAAAKFHLNLLGSEARSPEESQEIVAQVKQMLKEAIEKARSLSHELSPVLYQVDLIETLNWLARHMQRRHGLVVHVEAHGPADSSSEPLKAFLYRVAQELLFNVVKHAEVHEARIRVRRLGRCICLSVTDQGRGFDPQRLGEAGGFGLRTIRERVQLLGGQMKIKSTRGVGSRILIAVPDEELSQVAAPTDSRDGRVHTPKRQEDKPEDLRGSVGAAPQAQEKSPQT